MSNNYHRLSIIEKRRHAIDVQREPPMRCPACDMAVPADDLLKHQAERCPGRPAPHPRGKWIQPRDVRKFGLDQSTVRRWVRRGQVRVKGRGNARLYFSRDLVTLMAQDRAGIRARHRDKRGLQGTRGDLTPRPSHDRDADMEKYLTTADVADALGLAERQVKRMRERGDGPPFSRIGRAVRYRREDVEAWVEAQRVEVTP